MSGGHSHSHDEQPLTEAEAEGRRKVLRIMVMVLVPLFIWTLASMIWLWPRNTADHISNDGQNIVVPGATQERATITQVDEISCEGQQGTVAGQPATCGAVQATVSTGPEAGTVIQFQVTPPVFDSGVKAGQVVVVWRIPVQGQPSIYQFVDFHRSTPLWLLTGVFALLVVAVARWRGLLSLVGLGFAFWVLVKFMMPALISGTDPLLVGVVGSAAIMFVVLYTAHGFTLRTTTALIGTLFGLLIIAGLGFGVSKWAHLTGVTTEEDFSLAATSPDMHLTSVVIVAIIVAGLGVLNDVTITQASAVWELARTTPDKRSLFASAMRIGRDHIASTVYTIAFAAAGAALPVLLLLTVYQRPLSEVIGTEQFSGEIIRTLVGSIGLILAVPVTTAVGVAAAQVSGNLGTRVGADDHDHRTKSDATVAGTKTRQKAPATPKRSTNSPEATTETPPQHAAETTDDSDQPARPRAARRSQQPDEGLFRRPTEK